MQKITTFLWFDHEAEEAAKFYCSLFPRSRITRRTPGPGGRVLTVAFRLDGVDFVALNGGPEFHFTPAISLSVDCKTQAEVNRLWAKLGKGGKPGRCGWLTDKFGLSWQIVPSGMGELLAAKDRRKAKAAFDALMKMKKLDLPKLKRAFAAA